MPPWPRDLGLGFVRGCYRHGKLVRSPRAMAIRHLRSHFLPDVVIGACDWLSVAVLYLELRGASFGESKLLGDAKLARLLSIMGAPRASRSPEIIERVLLLAGAGGGC